MINVRMSKESETALFAELNSKVLGLQELSSSQTEKELMDAAFSIAALKFVKTTNMLARSKKQTFHHIYEWGQSGNESGRLFRIIKRNMGLNSATVYTRFINSKKKSPISSTLKTPGITGKSVTRSSIFKNKAEVMESGKPVGFITKRTIAFAPKGGPIVFVPAGKSIIIKNPGGEQTTGALSKHFNLWWNLNFPMVLDSSGVIRKLEVNVANALNKKGAGRLAARKAVSSTLAGYKIIGSVI